MVLRYTRLRSPADCAHLMAGGYVRDHPSLPIRQPVKSEPPLGSSPTLVSGTRWSSQEVSQQRIAPSLVVRHSTFSLSFCACCSLLALEVRLTLSHYWSALICLHAHDLSQTHLIPFPSLPLSLPRGLYFLSFLALFGKFKSKKLIFFNVFVLFFFCVFCF